MSRDTASKQDVLMLLLSFSRRCVFWIKKVLSFLFTYGSFHIVFRKLAWNHFFSQSVLCVFWSIFVSLDRLPYYWQYDANMRYVKFDNHKDLATVARYLPCSNCPLYTSIHPNAWGGFANSLVRWRIWLPLNCQFDLRQVSTQSYTCMVCNLLCQKW